MSILNFLFKQWHTSFSCTFCYWAKIIFLAFLFPYIKFWIHNFTASQDRDQVQDQDPVLKAAVVPDQEVVVIVAAVASPIDLDQDLHLGLVQNPVRDQHPNLQQDTAMKKD